MAAVDAQLWRLKEWQKRAEPSVEWKEAPLTMSVARAVSLL